MTKTKTSQEKKMMILMALTNKMNRDAALSDKPVHHLHPAVLLENDVDNNEEIAIAKKYKMKKRMMMMKKKKTRAKNESKME